MQNSTPPPLSIVDLERLIDKLNSNAKTDLPDDDDYSSVNAKRVMYRFWLRTDNESEQVLMQWLDLMKNHRKFQTFVKLALRASIFEVKEHYDYANDLFLELGEMFEKLDWSRE